MHLPCATAFPMLISDTVSRALTYSVVSLQSDYTIPVPEHVLQLTVAHIADH
jgi:hypothetical protein